MRMRIIETLVGVFMLAGIGALIFLALNVSGLTLSSMKDTYTLKARFENLAGLTVRAKVSISGVEVGKVTNITYDQNSALAEVEMKINKNVNTIPTDSTASIFTAGLLGEKYIGISIGADEAYFKDGDVVHDTTSGLVLEELIGKFLLSMTKSGASDNNTGTAAAPAAVEPAPASPAVDVK